VEERIARLEANVEHIQSDVSEIKLDIRGLRQEVRQDIQRLDAKIDEVDKRLGAKIDEVDKRLGTKIDEVDKRLGTKIDDVKDSVANLALVMEKGFGKLNVAIMVDRIWHLLMSAALLAVMARGFKWI